MAVNNIQFTGLELRIAKYLFKHYLDSYNPRQLSRTLSINHAHTNKLCHLLTFKNILIKKEIGNSIYFSYNYTHKLALQFMEYLLSLEEKEFPSWLTVALHSLEKFKPYLQMGLIFGSSIQNQKFNDIDVMLVYDKKEAAKIKKVKEDLRKSQLLEKPVRYMDLTETDITLNKKDKVFYSIFSENLIFCHPEKYAQLIRKCHK